MLLRGIPTARARTITRSDALARDDEGQCPPGLSDPRNAEVRPLARGCRLTWAQAALPVAEQSGRAVGVTGVGVEG
jgi:hypothetical protein